jgi:cell division initiation protein
MITAQDIREKTFDKAKFGGYDMASVDDFLEELAEDVTAAQKENAVLKSKMKILVDKIEEYRANEEALNMAVLSAQKLAVQIESEARERARAMIAEADRQVNAKIGGITEQAEAEERRLAAAKSSTLKFLEAMREVCGKQLQNIEDIGNGFIPEEKAAAEAAAAEAAAAEAAPAPAPAAPSIDDAVRSIERSVSQIQPEEPVDIDITPAMGAGSAGRFDSTQPFSF